jgi:hypothetical protein
MSSFKLAVHVTQNTTVRVCRVLHSSDEWAWAHPIMALTSAQAEEITDWVKTLELGSRLAYDMWKLKNEHALTLFLLKWNTQ